MRTKFKYFTIPNALPKEALQRILKEGKDLIAKASQSPNMNVAATNVGNYDPKTTGQRDTTVVWLDNDRIYDLLVPFLRRANQEAGWNFVLHGVQAVQFAEYAKGQYNEWHSDQHWGPLDMPEHKDLWRKLSLSVTFDSIYEGGDFELDQGRGGGIITIDELKDAGTILVFPSYLFHRVKPVTSGVRYSLVMWGIGPPFR